MPRSHHVCFARFRNELGEPKRHLAHAERALLLQRRREREEERRDEREDLGHARSLRRASDGCNGVEADDPVDEVEPFGAMRDQEDRAAVGGVEDVGDERLGRLAVEMRGRLVEDEHRRIGEERPRDDEALALAAGELRSLLPDERVEAVRERLDPVVEPRTAQRVEELAVGRVGSGEPQVLADRRVEDVRLLPGERERAADVLLPQLADVAPADRDPPGLRDRGSGAEGS